MALKGFRFGNVAWFTLFKFTEIEEEESSPAFSDTHREREEKINHADKRWFVQMDDAGYWNVREQSTTATNEEIGRESRNEYTSAIYDVLQRPTRHSNVGSHL